MYLLCSMIINPYIFTCFSFLNFLIFLGMGLQIHSLLHDFFCRACSYFVVWCSIHTLSHVFFLSSTFWFFLVWVFKSIHFCMVGFVPFFERNHAEVYGFFRPSKKNMQKCMDFFCWTNQICSEWFFACKNMQK
jgi:hypothetical protein